VFFNISFNPKTYINIKYEILIKGIISKNGLKLNSGGLKPNLIIKETYIDKLTIIMSIKYNKKEKKSVEPLLFLIFPPL